VGVSRFRWLAGAAGCAALGLAALAGAAQGRGASPNLHPCPLAGQGGKLQAGGGALIAGGSPTLLVADYGRFAVRPATIRFGLARSEFLSRIGWSSWTAAGASGRGTLILFSGPRGCYPDRLGAMPVTLQASGRNAGHFTRIAVVVEKSSLSAGGESFELVLGARRRRPKHHASRFYWRLTSNPFPLPGPLPPRAA